MDDNTVTMNADWCKKNDSADRGYSEKLNLDRSSGDDSLEEDVLESSKQIDSTHTYDEAVDKSEFTELLVVKEESSLDAMVVGSSPTKKVVLVVKNNNVAASIEKRKVEDQEAVDISEPSKRQRRWNLEFHKTSNIQASNVSPSSIPRDAFHSTPKRVFTRSESTLNDDNVPKERIVPPSQRSATTSLRIDRFLRPFTLKALQELLAKTGTVCSFWMDHIKTHCYVMYSSVDKATKTRNTLFNLQWPLNGGCLLIAEFVDPQEVQIRADAPSQSSMLPVSTKSTAPPPLPSVSGPPQQNLLRQKLASPPPLPPPPPVSDPHLVRERLPLPPPPPVRKPETTVVTLDDFFKKTKATPRIYYLPLSEEQVAAKLAS